MAGTDKRKPLIRRPAPSVVLVRPQMGENIGAAARAMKNFALGELRLVAPRDGWPNERAHAMSSRADDILDAARLFDATADAVADLNAVFATTARRRDLAKPALSPRDAAAEMARRIARGQRVGILFGAERAGLDNDDVGLADTLIHVPANPGYASLNLAQAVLIVAYEWFAADCGDIGADVEGEAPPPATSAELQFFYDRLEEALAEAGFLKPPEKRPSMMRNIRAMFQRAGLSEQEVRTLHGMISAFMRPRDED